MAIPIAGSFGMEDPKRRLLLGVIAVGIALIPVVGTILSVTSDTIAPVISSIRYFAFALLAFQVGTNLLAVRPARV